MRRLARTLMTFYIAKEIFAILIALFAAGLALWFLFQLPALIK